MPQRMHYVQEVVELKFVIVYFVNLPLFCVLDQARTSGSTNNKHSSGRRRIRLANNIREFVSLPYCFTRLSGAQNSRCAYFARPFVFYAVSSLGRRRCLLSRSSLPSPPSVVVAVSSLGYRRCLLSRSSSPSPPSVVVAVSSLGYRRCLLSRSSSPSPPSVASPSPSPLSLGRRRRLLPQSSSPSPPSVVVVVTSLSLGRRRRLLSLSVVVAIPPRSLFAVPYTIFVAPHTLSADRLHIPSHGNITTFFLNSRVTVLSGNLLKGVRARVKYLAGVEGTARTRYACLCSPSDPRLRLGL